MPILGFAVCGSPAEHDLHWRRQIVITDRFVTLNSAAVEVLKRLKKRREELGLPPNSTLFHSKRGGLINNPRKRFATALQQAEIENVSWHTLRHYAECGKVGTPSRVAS